MNRGFIIPEIKPEDYTFGAELPIEVLEPTGQWAECLPAEEAQYHDGFDSQNCTVYATLNCLEILYRRKYAQEENYSERYVGVMANTGPTGNTPQNIIETIRTTSGVIDERSLPFSDSINSWDAYYSPKPMDPALVKTGRSWLDYQEIKHDWVATDAPTSPAVLMEALKCSPLGAAVPQWTVDQNGVYQASGAVPVHYVSIVGFKEGEYWEVFDQYPPFKKQMAWDFPFKYVKRYYLRQRSTPEVDQIRETQLTIIGLCKKIISLITDYLSKKKQ